MSNTPQIIDMTPTWGEVGNMLAPHTQVLPQSVQDTLKQAFALAEAYRQVVPTLNDEQLVVGSTAYLKELGKQGAT